MYANKANIIMATYIIKLSNNIDNEIKFSQKRTIDEVDNFIKTLIEMHRRDKDCAIEKRTDSKFDCKIVHPESDITVYVRVYECHTLK